MPYELQGQTKRKKVGSESHTGAACGKGIGKRKYDVVEKIAAVLGTTPEYLLGQSGMLVVAAHEKGGSKAARDIDELVSEVTGMFAGGRLSDEALDGAMKALNEAYWIAKEKNKKYSPKKYRKRASEQ